MNYVHLGTGKIGLGLVGDIVSDLRLPVIFVNRDSDKIYKAILKEKKQYFLDVEGEIKHISPVNFITFNHENIDDPSNINVIEALSTAQLITLSVKPQNFTEISPIIIKSLEKRRTDASLKNQSIYLMAYENLDRNSQVFKKYLLSSTTDYDIKDFIDSKIIACNTIVDRVCTDFKENVPKYGEFCCPVEESREVIIEHPDDDPQFQSISDILGKHEAIKIVSRDEFELYEKRKYWLVNGIHLALATYALSKDIFLLNQAIKDIDIQRKILNVQYDFAVALEALAVQKRIIDGFNKEDLNKFNVDIIERFSKKRDDVTRILADLMSHYRFSQKIAKFTEKMNEENLRRWKKERVIFFKEFKPWIYNNLQDFYSEFDIGKFISKLNKRICEPTMNLFKDYDGTGGPREAHLLIFQILVMLEKYLTHIS